MHKSQRRSTKVCARCRQRKTKCDFKFPQCSACQNAAADCQGFDPATRQAVPRSLVRSLETRAAELEAKLLARKATPQRVSSSLASRVAQATVSYGTARSASFLQSKVSPNLFIRPSCPPMAISADPGNDRPQSSGSLSPPLNATRRRQTAAATHVGGGRTDKATGSAQPKSYTSSIMDLSSIPQWALDSMLSNYTDTHLPQYPCVRERDLRAMLHRTRNEPFDADDSRSRPSNPSFDHFVVFIVLAISALTMTWKDEHHARAASESFYKSALKHLQVLEDNSEIRSLQVSLLLAHFAHVCPERVDNWTCIADAIRIVLELGLYLESPALMDTEERDQRSDLFWAAYGMERSLCTNLRLPLSFAEDIITTPLKDPSTDIANGLDEHAVRKKSSANHIYRYRALETEVHRFLYLEEDLNHFNATNVRDWIADIMFRMQEWYLGAQVFKQYNMLEFRDVQYHHLKLRIHRPTPRLQARNPDDWTSVLDSALVLIKDYENQQRRRRLFYPWHGVHILFETVSSALYASWCARDDIILREVAMNLTQIWIPQCLEVLRSIGQRWNDGIRCADKLEPLLLRVSKALEWPTQISTEEAASLTSDISSLLGADKALAWNRSALDDINFGLENGSLLFDNILVDDLELVQWAPEWDFAMDDLI